MSILLSSRVVGRHYSFTNEGPVLFSASMAHVAVPLHLKPLEEALPLIHQLVSHVVKMAHVHANITQLQALANVVNEEYVQMDDKLSNVFQFFLKNTQDLPNPPTRTPRAITPPPTTTTTTERVTVATLKVGDVPVTEWLQGYHRMFDKQETSTPPLPLVADLPIWNTIKPKPKRKTLRRHQRKKRFIGGLIAGLFAAIGTSTLFGLFEGSKIEQLGKTLNSVVARQEQMIHLLDQESQEIATNRLAMKVLAKAVEGIERVVEYNTWLNDVQSVTLVVRHQILKVNQALDLYLDAIQAAANHRLAYGLLSFEAAENALNNVTQMAKKRQLTPILQTAQQIHQLPTSFLISDDGVTLILHIPLASEDTIFHLWRFTSFPLPIGKDVFGHIHSDKTLIALGTPDINHKPSYVELDDVDLNLCTKFYFTFICPHSRVISRPTRPSCLHALYHGEHELAIKLCKLHLSTDNDDTVIPLSQNEFVAYTKRPSVYTMNCPANASVRSGLQLFGVQTITVREGCQAILPKYKIQAASDIYYSAPPKAFTWTIPPLAWLESDMTITDLSTAVRTLEGMKGLPRIDPHQVDLVKRMSVPLYQNPGHQISWALAGLAAFGCCLLVLGVCVKTWCCGAPPIHLDEYSGAEYKNSQDPAGQLIRRPSLGRG